ILEAPMFQVAVKASLVDRHDGAQAHGHRGELPEIGHQPGVGVRRKAATAREFVPEVLQVRVIESALEEGPGINAGGRVALEIHKVAAALGLGSTKEVIKAYFVERG